ncbi:hypothetical protein MPSEU_000752800 [Mayamaea pseudoterrestris]|nr:hypothetical protein MPSEU_000752800 [Mayamaea pseudoterrestris]
MMHATSASSLMSDDVTVRCRVLRRSACSNQQQQPNDEEPQEMTCTLRHWDKTSPKFLSRRQSIAPSPSGPELLLTPLHDYLPPAMVRRRSSNTVNASSNNNHSNTDDDVSPNGHRRPSVRSSSRTRPFAPISSVSLPLCDLQMSQVDAQKREFDWMTGSHGCWRILGLDRNAFDILLAFLTARMQPERMVYLTSEAPNTCDDKKKKKKTSTRKPTYGSSSSIGSSSCLDVDTLTAAHLKGRANDETFSEKLSRRVSHVLAAVGDWTHGMGIAALMEDLDTKCCSENTVCCNTGKNASDGDPSMASSVPTRQQLQPLQQHSVHVMPQQQQASHSARIGDNHSQPIQQQVLRPFRYSDLEMDDNDSALTAGLASVTVPLASASHASSIMEQDGANVVADTQRL